MVTLSRSMGLTPVASNSARNFARSFLAVAGRMPLLVPADSFPVPLTLVVCVPEAVDFVVLSGARIALGGLTEEDALELGLYVFSFSFATHMSRLEDTTKEGKMLIQNLSKIDFQDKNLDYNILNLIIIYLFILAIYDRESPYTSE